MMLSSKLFRPLRNIKHVAPVPPLPQRTAVLIAHGRKTKTKTVGEINSDDQISGQRKTKGQNDKEQEDQTSDISPLLQQVDTEYLEELKRQAAEEEKLRQINYDPEADPKRINFHRVLLNAAQQGQVEKAEETIAQMVDSGFDPGPRAFHVLVFAYVKGKRSTDALDVARRANEAGFKLLPETFVVLIYSFLNLEDADPDLETATSLLESMKAQEGVEGAQPGWLMLCKELFRKGLSDEAMTVVKRGYDEDGYVGDQLLNQFVITELCKAGLKERAMKELSNMETLGYRPTPDHYNPIIQAVAAAGDAERARSMIQDAFRRPAWEPPNVESYDSLLSGMVISLKSGFDSDVASQMESTFGKLREEMLKFSLRPTATTYAHMCEAYIVLGDMDLALGALESLQAANGTTKLLAKKHVSKLLLTLAQQDRPVDMLNIFKFLIGDNLRLPRKAVTPLPDGDGRSILTAWMPSHMEQMRQNRGKSVAQTMMQEVRTTRIVDGVLLGIADCVVDENGVFVSPSKMTTTELQVECEAAGLPIDGLTRTQLSKQIKARRAELPENILTAQAALQKAVKSELKALGAEEKDGKRDGKITQKRFRVIQFQDGKLSKISNVVQEVLTSKESYTEERTAGEEPDFGSGMGGDDEDYGGDMEDLDDIMRSGVDEGVGDILRDEDTTYGDAEDMAELAMSQQAAEDAIDMAIEHYDARMLNKTAGMAIAVELLRAMEMLKARPTSADLETLVMGAVTEASPEAAVEVSQRLHRLLKEPGYSPEVVAGLYGQLARVCLDNARGPLADLVLERAEARALPVDPSLMAELSVALAGRPRAKELADKEMTDMTLGEGGGEMIGASAAGLLDDDEDEFEILEDEEEDEDIIALDEEEEDDENRLQLPPGSSDEAEEKWSSEVQNELEAGEADEDVVWEGEVEEYEEGMTADEEIAVYGSNYIACLDAQAEAKAVELSKVFDEEDLEQFGSLMSPSAQNLNNMLQWPLLLEVGNLEEDEETESRADAGDEFESEGEVIDVSTELQEDQEMSLSEVVGEAELSEDDAYERMQRGEMSLQEAVRAAVPKAVQDYVLSIQEEPLEVEEDELFVQDTLTKIKEIQAAYGVAVEEDEEGVPLESLPEEEQNKMFEEFEAFWNQRVNKIGEVLEEEWDQAAAALETEEEEQMDEEGGEGEEGEMEEDDLYARLLSEGIDDEQIEKIMRLWTADFSREEMEKIANEVLQANIEDAEEESEEEDDVADAMV
ncbi:hypothetical protein CEUSTIGMA_g2101.t1 [Chlamydomonas eustigma]|uniref:Pentacotripeptide-repeat region of PRORP domain-containing protein n=1 Tax=Chlamydomonas eustigma TaxID=1157962 RepID=A0A250WUY4_9CHLO|nr:hypothetical protein CEUSTIGMA_g2101.t1 [Chlamydomonas eustigma]|eukprot:GAX74653.1 hypothetical protein CEUSTIGMA_g2101.t1 [Chlamydomonas eustigma]